MRKLIAAAFIIAACNTTLNPPGDDDDDDVIVEPPVEPPDESARIFDDTLLHRVDLEVEEQYLDQLILKRDLPPGQTEATRVPARITFDGTTVDNIGVRLKGFIGSARTIDQKAGFSLKFDEFIQDQELFGERRLTLNNEVQDESFIARKISHALWERAGVPAPRTAYAEVYFNGVRFGLYVIEESTDKRFLKRHFTDASGNLYEGDARDVSSPNLDLDTNEELNDRSDLLALNEAVRNLPAEGFLTAISSYVDVDQFYRYWAVEAIIYHWDGYGVEQYDEPCCSPNNYYIYNDPGRGNRFVMLPHGADQVLWDVSYSIFHPPSPDAMMAAKLMASAEGRARFTQEVEAVLNEAWDTATFQEIVTRVEPVIRQGFIPGPDGGREEWSQNTFEEYLATRKDFILRRADVVRAQLAQGF